MRGRKPAYRSVLSLLVYRLNRMQVVFQKSLDLEYTPDDMLGDREK